MLSRQIVSLLRFSAPRIAITPAVTAQQNRSYFNWFTWLNLRKWPLENPVMDKKYVDAFNNPEINGFDIRRIIMEMYDEDFVPEPVIWCAALRACRRVNDFALAMRVQEVLKSKMGDSVNDIYPWMLQEIEPTLKELGIPTIEQMGYHEPKLWIERLFTEAHD